MTRREQIKEYAYEDMRYKIIIQIPKSEGSYDVLIIKKYAEGLNLEEVYKNDTVEDAIAKYYVEVKKQIADREGK